MAIIIADIRIGAGREAIITHTTHRHTAVEIANPEANIW